ncbi:MAG: tetratricopeptide repeat protein [Oryzomonas sp.]|uniref:tetratricopeptide repeat protein n=1 Tax=Oryzomonas sp. TaxID=2855186 RepID=UPI0028420C80|nr:tetratricopeptide repeat protein [Oryzomonas sp.]MDR3579837.1 tetratricopeptide repeat protein [Oryzomonas sp.]
MSSNKDKLIEEAQKFIQRGQLDKAVKIYVQVLSLEPSAINLRQKLAELFVKAGQPDSARTEYETIGKHYASGGFYQKAIAVFKQVQKLFPGDVATTLTLAGLNEKHGLVGNALAEYKLAYDYYERESNAAESLKILEKMQNVDPQNANIKFKLAEAYFHADRKQESYALFGQLALLLQARGESGSFANLNTRVQQLFPEKTEFVVEVLANQLEEGNIAKAVSGLQVLLRNNPKDKKVWELIIRAYRRLEQPQQLLGVYQHFMRYFPDEVSAKTGLIACHADLKDIKGALALLDRFEHDVISSGAYAELVAIYRSLADFDPINSRILEGYRKVCVAAGMLDEAGQLEAKIQALNKFSSKNVLLPESTESPAGTEDFVDEGEDASEASALPDDLAGMDAGVYMPEKTEPAAEIAAAVDVGVQGGVDALPDEDEIEIELDIDDFPFESPAAGMDGGGAPDGGWPEAFGDVTDSISSTPRSVRFGSSLDGSDSQSHYDLGVAFKEMGLYDEAINEFQQAAGDPARRVECLALQAVCLRERGDLDAAEGVLNALMKPGLSLEDACIVKYELALVLEAQGHDEKASALMAEIDAVNADFRDVHARLKNAGDSLDFSDEELRDFELK